MQGWKENYLKNWAVMKMMYIYIIFKGNFLIICKDFVFVFL